MILFWIDKNGNGKQDAGEQPVVSLQVVLHGVTNYGTSVTNTTFTDALGEYIFDNLTPGTLSR